MKLHQNIKLFQDAVKFTAQQMNIPPEFIEKDYWVTYALYTIFNNPIGADTVFKGGTALSKCYKLIDRFSEDIDLVVLRKEGESNNQLTNKIKKISEVVGAVLPEVQISELTQKMGMNRKTAHSYSKIFTGSYGQIRDVVIVEATWLGYFEPYSTKQIASLVGEMMIRNGQESIAKEHSLLPFEVRVLEPIRTLCEKIMSLVRFSYSENPIDDLKKKIRHTYDLYRLLQKPEFRTFFESKEFEDMLIKVANDDIVSFKNNNKWLAYHPNESLLFNDIERIWTDLESTYKGEFKALVYGELPSSNDILDTIRTIRTRMKAIEWNIEI